jgi:hypothetical protein
MLRPRDLPFLERKRKNVEAKGKRKRASPELASHGAGQG